MHSSIGGAGMGDPLERDPERIVEDIKNGYATLDVSKNIYLVSIDPKSLKIDFQETKSWREGEIKERLKKGIPGAEFLKQLVDKRQKRNLPKVALDFMDETTGFCEAYKDEIEKEKEAIKKDWKPIGKNGKIEEELLELTLYVNVGRMKDGKVVTYCKECGFIYGDCADNFKYYCLIYEKSPLEVFPGTDSNDRMAPDPDWCVFREFYCPGCGRQIEVESTAHGTPIVHNYNIPKEKIMKKGK